jgi:aldehyde:ferredoxin oxidoreductase
MLDDYYDLRGWTVEEGRPTAETLARLDIEEFAADTDAESTPA